ncbi:MAG: DUF2169 domain-containing protein [Alcanivorax sp.]|nr:DUF2169 domain-containing protein [Alcanivorax sp.]
MHELINPTPLAAALRPGWAPNRRFQDTLILKQTWHFALDGTLTSETQPLCEADAYHGEPLLSSLAASCETVPFKQGSELYLHGTAHPPRQGAPAMEVAVALTHADGARWEKRLAVLGESHWQRALLGYRRSPLAALKPLPLHYEYAYGGTCPDTEQRLPENPAGRGFNPGRGLRDNRAPQIEWPTTLQTRPGQQVAPAGLGPLASFWTPRHQAGGTFPDERMPEDGCPIALDAKPDLHNAAPLDQRFSHPFSGGEQLTLHGFFAEQTAPVTLTLPASLPQVLHNGGEPLPMTCDTLVIDCDTRLVSRLFRAGLPQQRLRPVRHRLTVVL